MKNKSTNLVAGERPRVVVLVDSKTRDLPLAALIAHHLDNLGVDCFLEPLEAYRAVLGAYRPHMIVFNHLTASHLVAYSKRLHEMGVLTAVLPNEGINYDQEDLKFNSGKHHSGAHIDYFFCWNELHKQTLLESGHWPNTKIEVIGVPRFDFYFEPWSRISYQPDDKTRKRPRILLCTNFSIARFWELPKTEADKFFAAWKDRIPVYKNYWKSVEDNFNARKKLFDYLDSLASADKFDLVLRPHPREDVQLYANWLAQLPEERKKWVTLDPSSSITPLILDCDLEISCETCTTAMESWIASKPTLELIFFKNPMFFHEEHGKSNTHCERPEDLPGMIETVLKKGESKEILASRQRHLAKWCNSPDGTSCELLAKFISDAVHQVKSVDWSGLNATDKRRATKLKLMRNLGLAYHFDPLMPVKVRVNRGRYAIKSYAYDKSIKPRDVKEARAQLVAVLGKKPKNA